MNAKLLGRGGGGLRQMLLCALLVFGGALPAAATDKVTFLFAAPPFLPANGQMGIALGRGYFAAENIEVTTAVGKGGVDVAKQLGAGNADFGMVLADSPIIVRPNGIPVRTAAVFGGESFMQLVIRKDAGITDLAGLKGKTIGVLSFQDTTFYALQGVLAAKGLSLNDVNAQALGPTNVWKLLASGQTQACACVPDWIAAIEETGTAIDIVPTGKVFPSMAQGIGVSDSYLARNPDLVRRFVRAALRGMRAIMDDPQGAARDFVKFTPENAGREAYVARAFNYYDKFVFPGQSRLGEVNVQRLASLQKFYLEKGIIEKASPLEDLYAPDMIP